MTDEEKQAVLQFMGVAYGDAHQQDQMIVGKSGQLQPSSHVMKERFEEVLRTPTQPQQQFYAHAPAQEPAQEPVPSPEPVITAIEPVSMEEAARELAQLQAAPTPGMPPPEPAQPMEINDQLEFDLSEPTKLDQLFELVKSQTLLLEEISLKLDNGKRAKSTKKR